MFHQKIKQQKQMSDKVFQRVPDNEDHQKPSLQATIFSENEKVSGGGKNQKLLPALPIPFNKIRVGLITIYILMAVITCYCWKPFYTPAILPLVSFDQQSQLLQQRFPRILWIYTQNQRDAERMEEDIYLNYFEDFAKKANYQIRYTTGLSAYDYLSNQTIKIITDTMNKRIVDETVHSFLKLALLQEHGGIIVEPGTIFLSNNFGWIERMFDRYQPELNVYACKPSQSSLFIPKNGSQYSAVIMAALPKNPLIEELFTFLSEVVTNDEYKRKHALSERYNIKGVYWNETIGVYGFNNTLNTVTSCFNHLLKLKNKISQQCYGGIQEPIVNMTLFVAPYDNPSPYDVGRKVYGFSQLVASKGVSRWEEVKAIAGFKSDRAQKMIISLALDKYDRSTIENTLMHKVLQAPGNREIILQDLPERQIELCLVIMEGLDNQQLRHTSTLFTNQTYSKWKLVMPAKDISIAPKFQDPRIVVIQQKSTKVHNIEKALCKHCSHGGYAVMLNYNQSFTNQRALQNIAKAAQPRHVAGVYIPLQQNNQVYDVVEENIQFRRFFQGIKNPKLDKMKHMLNHLRVFSVQTFKTLPQYALRDWNGVYIRDRILFLMDFHDLIDETVNKTDQLYLLKRHARFWNMPNEFSILKDDGLLRVNHFEEIDREQLVRMYTRITSRHVRGTINDLRVYKIPISKVAVFNPGNDFLPVQQKKGPELIPRIVHQVWLGSEIPPAKNYFIEKTKKLYSGYQIKVWRESNISRQLFPTTYDIIRNLIDFNNRSPYSKFASVTDIMRHEILYREGGLWKDAGMNMLRRIPDVFLRYKLILPTDRFYQARYLQGMCFFGNMPGLENLLRINSYPNLNRMRIHNNDPFPVAGPVDFRQLVVGQEEFDPQFLLLPYETFYPGQIGMHPDSDLCTTRQIGEGQPYEIQQDGYYLLPDCEKNYPFAFALEHNIFGSTWVRRWRNVPQS